MLADKREMTLWRLSWPIFIELLLQLLLGTADTLMVSRVSDDAVAVVGFSNQLFNAMTTLFMTVANGAGIVIAQKLGAGKREDARTVGVMAFKICLGIGLLLSAALYAGAQPIARLFQLEDRLLPLAGTYISIVGGGMVLTALSATLGTVIRNTGNTKGPMITAVGMNIIHIFCNIGFIYGAYGFPKWGLTGVAVSTLFSRTLAALLLLYMFRHAFERKIGFSDLRLFNRRLFREVMRIGWPLGVNMSSWFFTQLAIYMFLAMMGAKELSARTYMNTLESFCFMLGSAVAMGVQIQIAYLYGARRTKEAYRSAYRGLWIGLGLVMFNALIVYFGGRYVLGWFTSDPEIIALGASCLAFNLVLQPGKMWNMALGNALNAVGDTRFTMIISLLSMWGVATGLSYWLGIRQDWGLAGVYAGMIADEYLRGVIVSFRWRQRKFLRRAEREGSGPGHLPPGGTPLAMEGGVG